MTTYRDSDEFRGAEFTDVDMTGARFREVELSGTRMCGVILADADIDGYIQNLMINGVDDLDRIRDANRNRGGPSPARRDAKSCLLVIFDEEWAHHQFAVRDLATIEGGS